MKEESEILLDRVRVVLGRPAHRTDVSEENRTGDTALKNCKKT